MDRVDILLQACADMLRKCDQSHFVVSPMEVTVFYDDAECDGFCLLEDIEHELSKRREEAIRERKL